MSTFIQWMSRLPKSPEPKQFTWLCGSEVVLKNEVLSYITKKINAPDHNYRSLDAEQDSMTEILNALWLLPMGPEKSLVVIHNAQKLSDTDFIDPLVSDWKSNPRRFVIFVSTEEKAPTVYNRDTKRRTRVAHIAAIARRGSVIECKPFADLTSDRAIEWVQYKIPATKRTALHLLEKSGGNLRVVRDVCAKIRLMGVVPTIHLINALTTDDPSATFVEALLHLDHLTALQCLEKMDTSEYSEVIGSLDSYLELCSLLHDMKLNNRPMAEMLDEAGNRAFLVPQSISHTAHYNPVKVMNIRKVLVACDKHLRDGQTEGVMESVIAHW